MRTYTKKINKKPSEKKMVEAILNLFRRKGLNSLFTEVQFCERYIDVLCLDDKTQKFLAVEAKVKAPSSAFRQAERYKYIADYVYVAVLENGSNKTALELSERTGIGLMFVRRDSLNRYYAKIAINPKISDCKDTVIADYVWNLRTGSKRTI